MKKLKYEILFTILFMTIGIAAVTGNLFISGSTELAANNDDFDVYFSDVTANQPGTTISINTSKSFEITTELKELNEEDKVNFKITNASQNYDAEVAIDCSTTSAYLRVIPHLADTIVPARSEIDGYVTIKLIKQVINDKGDQSISCNITASAVEKTTLSTGTDYTEKKAMLISASQRDSLPFETGTFEDIKSEYIRTITFEDEINIPDDAIEVWDFGVAQNGDVMAYVIENEDDGNYYDLYIQSNEQLYANPNMSYWFADILFLETINNLTLLDTSNVTSMKYLFSNNSLSSVDLSNFNTSNVTDMEGMFAHLYFSSLDISSLDTSKVTNMSSMFENMFAPSLDFSNFDTRNVTNMSSMFSYNGLEIIDLSSFDTSNVTNMSYMFSNVSFTELDLNHFDTSSVIDMSLMFANASEINTSITIMNPKTIHEDMFVFSGGEIILNYTESTSSLVDDMINFAYESNVIKGELIN